MGKLASSRRYVISLSLCHFVTLSPCHLVTLSPCHAPPGCFFALALLPKRGPRGSRAFLMSAHLQETLHAQATMAATHHYGRWRGRPAIASARSARRAARP